MTQKELEERVRRTNLAITEVFRLADFLNLAASRGAGFEKHWGERVMQAIEPLRDVILFENSVYRHNRLLLEHNGKLVDELKSLRELNQELWEHLTPEARHELNKKYAASNLQSQTDHEQRTQKKGE